MRVGAPVEHGGLSQNSIRTVVDVVVDVDVVMDGNVSS